MGKETLEEATMRYLAEENNNLVESTRETEITITKPISTYIEITDDREEWDYPIEDMDEARANNDYLVIDTTEPRVYEVTEDEFNLIKSKLEENVSLKVEAKTLTWNEIMDNAEGTTFGQKALKVKDTARDNVEQLMQKDGVNIEELESVEDAIEDYTNKNNIKFDESGNILNESKLVERKQSVTEYIISFMDGELYDEYDGEFITEDKVEADALFDELKAQHKLNQVDQYIAKTWVWNMSDYDEDTVEVYFNNGDEQYMYEESKLIESNDVDLPESFYEKVCRAYVDTMNLEWVAEDKMNGTVVHGYFEDDDYANKFKDKVNNDNFKDIYYGQYTDDYIEAEEPEYYSYQSWEDFYYSYVEDNIKYDVYDIGIEDFYVSLEDLDKLGIDYSEALDVLNDNKVDESKSLTETVDTNEDVIIKTMQDKDFLKILDVSPLEIIDQVKLSKAQFDELDKMIKTSGKSFDELYDELGGWNLDNPDKYYDVDNYFDCYYKSLLVTVKVKDGNLMLSPKDVYVYPSDISGEPVDELFHLDFDEPIDYTKIENQYNKSKQTESKYPKKIKTHDGYVLTKVNDGLPENANIPEYMNDNGDVTLVPDVDKYEILEEAKSNEYALNVKNKTTDEFMYQVDCYPTYEVAKAEADKLNLNDNETYYIVAIDYGEDENEIGISKIEESDNDKAIWEKVEKIVDEADNDLYPDSNNDYEYDAHIVFNIYRDAEFEDIFVVTTYFDGEIQDELDTGDVHLEDLDRTLVDIVKKLHKKQVQTESKSLNNEDVKNLLDNGNVVTVGGKQNYTPTDFYVDTDKDVWYTNKEISFGWEKHPTMDYNALLDHLSKMQKDGFTIEVSNAKPPKVEEVKSIKTESNSILKNIHYEDKVDEWMCLTADIDEDLGKDIISTFKDYEDDDGNVITNIRIDYNTADGTYIVNYVDMNGEFHEIDYKLTSEEVDKILELAWKQLEDVPFVENENNELVLDTYFLCFDKGTPREDIWHWFDSKYSKGVAYLLNEYNLDESKLKKVEDVGINDYESVYVDQKEELSDGRYHMRLVCDGYKMWINVGQYKGNGAVQWDYDFDSPEYDVDAEDYINSSVDVNDIEEAILKAILTKKTEGDNPDVEKHVMEYLESNQLYPSDVFTADDRVMVEISWGDWKHDHIRCDKLMENLGYTLVEEEVTEEDGSDCYSAIRHYIPKGSISNLDESVDTKIAQDRKSFIDKWKDHKDFKCSWCGTKFTGNIDDEGKMPNCPHCMEDRYAEDENKAEDGHANKDVHFCDANGKEIYTDFDGTVIEENKGLKTEVLEEDNATDKVVKIMAYGKIYYELSEDEYHSKSEDEIQSMLVDAAYQASEEEGFTVYTDEIEIVTESKQVKTEAEDDWEEKSFDTVSDMYNYIRANNIKVMERQSKDGKIVIRYPKISGLQEGKSLKVEDLSDDMTEEDIANIKKAIEELKTAKFIEFTDVYRNNNLPAQVVNYCEMTMEDDNLNSVDGNGDYTVNADQMRNALIDTLKWFLPKELKTEDWAYIDINDMADALGKEIVRYDKVLPTDTGIQSIFNFSDKNGGACNSFKYYNDYVVVDKRDKDKKMEAIEKEGPTYNKLCKEIQFQAEENNIDITEEQVKKVADKICYEDRYFFNNSLPEDEEDWSEVNTYILQSIKTVLGLQEDYKSLDKELDKLIDKDATDKELNDFIEKAADDDTITNNEYTELVNKAQDIRRINEGKSIKVESKLSDEIANLDTQIKILDLDIKKKVKQYTASQKRYNGDNAESDRLEAEIDSLELEQKKLQRKLNQLTNNIQNDPEYREYVVSLLKDGAIDDPAYVNGLSTEEFDDLVTNTWMKDIDVINSYIDAKNLNEGKSIKVESKYDTMAFAQLLPMSFTDMVDNDVYDRANEIFDDGGTNEDVVDYYINMFKGYIEDDEEALDEFDEDLAKKYIEYKMNTNLTEKKVTENVDINPSDAKNVRHAVNYIVGGYYNCIQDNTLEYLPKSLQDLIEEIYESSVNNEYDVGYCGYGRKTRTRLSSKEAIVKYIKELLRDEGDVMAIAEEQGWDLSELDENKSLKEGTENVDDTNIENIKDILVKSGISNERTLDLMSKDVLRTLKSNYADDCSVDGIYYGVAITDAIQKVIERITGNKPKMKFGEGKSIKTEDVNAIMQGKDLSVKDKEILDYVIDKLEAELGTDWKSKSLIDIEDITYDAVYEWANTHDESDINPQPYYVEIKQQMGRLDKINEGKSIKCESTNKDVITITDGTNSTELDYNSLDFGIGDYFYNGNETGAQIGFYWNEYKDMTYVNGLYLTVYVGDESNDDLETLDKTLRNLTPNEPYKVTLSDEDYKTFLDWKAMCDKTEFTYWNNLFEDKALDENATDDRFNSTLESWERLGYKLYKQESTITVLINDSKDMPIAIAFNGKASKPIWHYKFSNMDDLDSYVNKSIENAKAREQSKADRKAQRKLTSEHDIKVGDIFYTSWGYDQTNTEFYEVVNVRGSRIDLKEIGYTVDYEKASYGREDITPVPHKFVNDEVHTVSARADGTVTDLDGKDFLNLYRYTGGSHEVTATGWGH